MTDTARETVLYTTLSEAFGETINVAVRPSLNDDRSYLQIATYIFVGADLDEELLKLVTKSAGNLTKYVKVTRMQLVETLRDEADRIEADG